MTRDELTQTWGYFVAKTGEIPTEEDWRGMGITRHIIRNRFGNMTKFNEYCEEIGLGLELKGAPGGEGSKETKPTDEILTPSETSYIGFKRYVITSAQNNTEINQEFYQSLLTYCEVNDAKLMIIPVVYRYYGDEADKRKRVVKWPQEVKDHAVVGNVSLNDNVEIRGDVSIVATARNPLSGLETLSGRKSAIYGHGQLQMKMVATPKPELPKMLHTTGSISVKNYSDTKAGIIGDFNHSFSALVVEVEDEVFHVRQLCAGDDGSFYDLECHYHPDHISDTGRVPAMIFGDIHAQAICEDVWDATWAYDGIVDALLPEDQILHDVLDFGSKNHHHRGRTFLEYKKHHNGSDSVLDEMNDLKNLHNTIWNDEGTDYHYIASNHHDALTRWLEEADPKEDPRNAAMYHSLMTLKLECIDAGENTDVMELWLKGEIDNPYSTHFHDRDERFLIKGIDLNNHGDKGANGARGSAASFAKAGYKTVTGHTHTPQIEKGAWVVGCSCNLDMGYNTGYSSWMNTHCVIYPNGKRQLINIIKGKWRV